MLGRESRALPLSDNTVSRRHCELVPSEGNWILKDLGSRDDDPKFFQNDRLFEPRPFDADDQKEVDVRSRGIVLTDDYAPVENLLAPATEPEFTPGGEAWVPGGRKALATIAHLNPVPPAETLFLEYCRAISEARSCSPRYSAWDASVSSWDCAQAAPYRVATCRSKVTIRPAKNCPNWCARVGRSVCTLIGPPPRGRCPGCP